MFFFFNDTATTEIYTLSLHDALPIWPQRAAEHQSPGRGHRGLLPAGGQHGPRAGRGVRAGYRGSRQGAIGRHPEGDRKSTRLNSSHANISYAVFCLKKKQSKPKPTTV